MAYKIKDSIKENFIRYGCVQPKSVREFIVSKLERWEPIIDIYSVVPSHYVSVFNSFINNERYKITVKLLPEAINEIAKTLFKILNAVCMEVEKEKNSIFKEYELLKKFMSSNTYDEQVKYINNSVLSEIDIMRYKNMSLQDIKNWGKISKNTLVELLKWLKISPDVLKNIPDKMYFSLEEFTEILRKLGVDINSLSNKFLFFLLWYEILNSYLTNSDKNSIISFYIKNLDRRFKHLQPIIGILRVLGEFFEIYNDKGIGYDPGYLRNIELDKVLKYVKEIKNYTYLKRIAELLGKMLEVFDQVEYEKFSEWVKTKKYEKIPFGSSEIIGITQGDNIGQVLPIEFSMLENEMTESLFLIKLYEKKLMQFEFVSDIKVEKDEKNDKGKEKGPVILVIDTSSSMRGEPEIFAKALAIAITSVAHKQKRKTYIINFSVEIETLEIDPEKNEWVKLLEFIAKSFYGGTDPTEALEHAVDTMLRENYRRADLVFISDGVFMPLDEETENKIKDAKENGNKFYGMIVDIVPEPKVLKVFDMVWEYSGDMYSFLKGIKDELEKHRK